MNLEGVKAGDRLFLVDRLDVRNPRKREVEVEKVGREWLYVVGDHKTRRYSIKTGLVDNQGRGSATLELYRCKADHDDEVRRGQLIDELRNVVVWGRLNHVPTVQLEAILKTLKGAA